MEPLTREDLLSLEDYEAQRGAIQERMRTHKALRRLDLDPHVSLFFEDRNTMWYQVQEMARAERLFRPEELDEELGRPIVKVKHPETDEVIRQIPPEEMVALAKQLREQADGEATGLLVDEFR